MYGFLSFFDELIDGPDIARVEKAEEMMWDAFLLFFGDLVGDYGESAIHLHGVGINDFAIQGKCEFDCELKGQ